MIHEYDFHLTINNGIILYSSTYTYPHARDLPRWPMDSRTNAYVVRIASKSMAAAPRVNDIFWDTIYHCGK